MTEAIRRMAEEMPDHQTSRGAEFRNISVEERYGMARALVIARSQANATNANWESRAFRYHMRRKKESYMYSAGRHGVDTKEARAIWNSIVYANVDEWIPPRSKI